jgi:polyketide synthase Type III
MLQAARARPIIAGVGTAAPGSSYSQREVLDLFGIQDHRTRSLFLNSAIARRHLILPPVAENGMLRTETQGELLQKHRSAALDIGARAIRACLEAVAADPSDISFLCCATTTGFLTPAVSALLCQELGLKNTCARLDIVGMGCSAGLNALNATATWAAANPGKLGIMLCVEICSAGYVFDGSMRTAVVNSLFGDGAAAAAIRAAQQDTGPSGPTILKFNSRIVTEAQDAMRFDWDETHGKFSFFLLPEVPYLVGASVAGAIDELLSDTGVRHSAVAHWVVHSGGKKVIDAVRVNLGLSAYDLRHTTNVLRDYGNLSSGSFLFSYECLMSEGRIAPGDFGVIITMGPGLSIESALIQW